MTSDVANGVKARRLISVLKFSAAFGALMVSGVVAEDARAQSTASQMQEIIVTGTRETNRAGLIAAEQAAKSRSSISQEYIGSQMSGQTILETINLLPGVNFNNSDAYGNSGGNIRLRGFDGNRISLQFDGIPLNDTGNYATYSNQQLDSEVINKTNVNLGTTDVDSPTASATGGTINYVSRKPYDEADVTGSITVGMNRYRRFFGSVDTGEVGPLNTKSFLAYSYTKYDKWKGPGSLEKKQFNGRIYQEFNGDDFVAIGFHYNENRNNFYNRVSKANAKAAYAENPVSLEYLDTYARDTTLTAAGVDTDPTTGSSYYGLNINPSNTGNLRAQSKFTLSDDVVLTFDPYIQYTLANGGGSGLVYENDWRLITNAAGQRIAKGIDLNGDCTGKVGGVIALGSTCAIDQVRLYRPSNTNTWRPGLTSSVIWDIDDTNKLRFAYTLDYGRHRQTGEFGYIDEKGNPYSVWGGKETGQVRGADGSILQNRNRYSVAQLNQFSAEYTTKLMDERLRLTMGVRAPFFKRELNQYCYSVPAFTSNIRGNTQTFTASSDELNTNQYCASTLPSNAPVATTLKPYQKIAKYDDLLPNFSVGFKPSDDHLVYASYSEGISVPRTDNLYGLVLTDANPETTQAFDVGYRYQAGWLTGSVATYYNRFKNRIQSSYDDIAQISYDRNVGRVDLYGFDAEVGVEVIDDLTLYTSVSHINSEVKNDYRFNATTIIAAKGKELTETPDWTLSGRVDYDYEDFSFGVNTKYVAARWANDVNTEKSDSYVTVNVDVSYDLDTILGTNGSRIKLNVTNLFDQKYLGTINGPANPTQTGGNYYGLGAPLTVQGSLQLSF